MDRTLYCIEKESPFSYVIEANGRQQLSHANHLRKYLERVSEATVHDCAIIFDTDRDFGNVPTLDIQSMRIAPMLTNSNTHGCGSLVYDAPTYDDIDSRSDNNHAGRLTEDSNEVTLDFDDVTLTRFQYSKPKLDQRSGNR